MKKLQPQEEAKQKSPQDVREKIFQKFHKHQVLCAKYMDIINLIYIETLSLTNSDSQKLIEFFKIPSARLVQLIFIILKIGFLKRVYLEKTEFLNNCILKTFGLKLHYQMGTKKRKQQASSKEHNSNDNRCICSFTPLSLSSSPFSLSLIYFIRRICNYAAFLASNIPKLSKISLDVRIYLVFSLGGSRLFNTQSRHQKGKSFSSSVPSKSVIFFLHGPP